MKKNMNRFARTASIKNYKIVSIIQPFSFFDFIDEYFQNLSSLRRLLSQIRQLDGKTMVIEEIDKADDLDEEDEDIRKCCPDFNKSKSFRISFFTKAFSVKRDLIAAGNNDFIGYAIVKTDKISSLLEKTRIYESVIRSSRHPNNFIRGAQKWTCYVLNNAFEVEGYLYAQQNALTNSCAHVALRTASARYHQEGDMSYREMNNLVEVDHIQKKGYDGLNVEEMVQILEAAGARCFVGNYTNKSHSSVPFQK